MIGVCDTKLKERLLREPNLDLPKAEKLCYAAEAVQRQMKHIHVGDKNNGNVSFDEIHQSNSKITSKKRAHAFNSRSGNS